MPENIIEVKCPRCGQKTIYSPVNQFRPFCSERCKLIDLGEWASNKYAIPTNEKVDPNSQTPTGTTNQFPSNVDDEKLQELAVSLVAENYCFLNG